VFIASMTAVIGLLMLGDGGHTTGFILSALDRTSDADNDAVFRIEAELDGERWQNIVIHHLGLPAGDAETVHRLHQGYGHHGLGYHFLIGNGSGLGDGVVHVGYRWNQQLPGVHTVGPDAWTHNQHSIGICLIGNGDRRPFTRRQIEQLAALVQRLRTTLDIPRDGILLHRDVAPDVSSPGKFFQAGRFEANLR
jgi:N-acetyl-anhydromuramyl-L-alanine amidase AmpD